MKNPLTVLLAGLAILFLLHGCATTAPGATLVETPVKRAGTPLFLAHSMPWYQAPPTSKGYGWHWHMGFFDPYAVNADGTRPLATHDYPLIGPYDSSDPTVIEYQLLTMKAAGIEGVIIDWYGIDPGLDYAPIHRASQVLFDQVKRAGMTFAVCYEDQSITKLVQAKAFPQDQAVARAQEDFRWMEAHWWGDPAYLKIDGRPVVLDFGPQEFSRWSDWEAIFSATKVRPYFVSLEDHRERDTDGFFNWPEMSRSADGVLSLDTLVKQLNRFYAKTRTRDHLIATAWPGFHDIYQEAGVGRSYGFLDDFHGVTFRLTLDAALASKPDVIQLATWNDYGEGTVLEPNHSRGYAPLEDLQTARRSFDRGFAFEPSDLRIPLEVWKRRGDHRTDQAVLDRIAAAFFSGDAAAARTLVAGLPDPSAPPASHPGPEAPQASAAPGSPANLAYRKPGKSNNHIFDFTADKATDGDVLTYWEGAANSYPNDFTVDLGEEKSVERLIVRLNPKRIWQARTQTIEVLASGDGQTFTSVAAPKEYGFDPGSGNAVSIPVAAKTRFLMLRFTANTGATAGQMAELEVYPEK